MADLKFAILGAGFWASYQLAAWQEVKGAKCVAIYNRTRAKAEILAHKFHIPSVYDDAELMIEREALDFVDIITDVDTHSRFIEVAVKNRVATICQKPLAPSLTAAERIVRLASRANVPLAVHENWRWQTPIRALKKAIASGVIGEPFRARIDMISGFPVFKNQPFLKDLEQFIVTDLGSHTLDTARFLFGEVRSLFCRTQRVHNDIKGEDVATISLGMRSSATVTINMAYAENHLEAECFPQTLIFVEGTKGSISLDPNYWLRITTRTGTHSQRHPPPRYAWADPAYDVVQSSMVPCHENILRSFRNRTPAETSGADNLETVKLVFGCYQSARNNQVLHLKG
jgi:predicted dehydrogenase